MNARDSLTGCLRRILSGPWHFIQLRGVPVDVVPRPDGDVDLLGSRESLDALLAAAFEWVRAGDCHLRVNSRNRRKVQLTLFSPTGEDHVVLDLWIELWQLDKRRKGLNWKLLAAAAEGRESVRRLPAALEAGVYLHHLACKRRNPGDPAAAARLRCYRDACREGGEEELAAAIDAALEAGGLPPSVFKRADELLYAAVPQPLTKGPGVVARNLLAKFPNIIPGMPRRVRMVSVMGCDGSGKSSLAAGLAADSRLVRGVFVGKHLYRKNWIYKLGVIFLRPLLFQDRERFDDTMAPLAYCFASLRLRVKCWFARDPVLLIDRTLMDFLLVGRKTDAPRFSRFAWLARFMGPRIPVVHLVASFETVSRRKREMTAQGHGSYDMLMFRCHTGRAPTDYTAFYNGGPLESATPAAARVLRIIRGKP